MLNSKSAGFKSYGIVYSIQRPRFEGQPMFLLPKRDKPLWKRPEDWVVELSIYFNGTVTAISLMGLMLLVLAIGLKDTKIAVKLEQISVGDMGSFIGGAAALIVLYQSLKQNQINAEYFARQRGFDIKLQIGIEMAEISAEVNRAISRLLKSRASKEEQEKSYLELLNQRVAFAQPAITNLTKLRTKIRLLFVKSYASPAVPTYHEHVNLLLDQLESIFSLVSSTSKKFALVIPSHPSKVDSTAFYALMIQTFEYDFENRIQTPKIAKAVEKLLEDANDSLRYLIHTSRLD